jgi:hypothetical protein
MMGRQAEIVTWAEVRPGDRVLDDDEILTVEHVETRGRVLEVRYTEYGEEWTRFPAAHLVARLLP